MKVSNRNFISCEEVNKIDLVEYLSSIGYAPAKVTRSNYWYLSPLPARNERTPSFKVNRIKNTWYDFGIGLGGSLTDFCILHDRCTIRELLDKFSNYRPASKIVSPRQTQEDQTEPSPLMIFSIHSLRSYPLIRYLTQRKIDLDIAKTYCREAAYFIRGREYYAIAFANQAGGYELRNKYFKGSSSPKGISYLDNGARRLFVFEGFFDFLTFCSITKDQGGGLTNFLILNSLSFLSRSRQLIESHARVHLFLDNDEAGNKATNTALSWSRYCIDQRAIYKNYKDLNQWACDIGKGQKPSSDSVSKDNNNDPYPLSPTDFGFPKALRPPDVSM